MVLKALTHSRPVHRRIAHDIAARAGRGTRNWDYRTAGCTMQRPRLLALNAGYRQGEGVADWLLRAAAGPPAAADHLRTRRRTAAAQWKSIGCRLRAIAAGSHR